MSKGEDLTDFQKYLGDQWTDLTNSSFEPRYIVIFLGSNNVDKLHNKIIKSNIKKYHHRFAWGVADKMLKSAYDKCIEKVDIVLKFLHDVYPQAEFLYSKILPRCWWGVHAHQYARWLDYYVLCVLRKKYRIREIWACDVFGSHYQFHENVEFGFLKQDMVHLNNNGNRAMVSAVMKPLLHKWKWAK